ncbi:MAG: hypothetical protein HQK76_08545 [Desulfobacterales bacterium]|nr:hypothetical protein [Desulfobacterales bacterium]
MDNYNQHLNEDIIIMSIIDKNNIDVFAKKHLKICNYCAGKRVELINQLSAFSTIAKKATPLPSSICVLDFTYPSTWFKPIFALGFILIMLFSSVYFGRNNNSESDLNFDTDITQEILLIDQWGLPDYYIDISASNGDYLDDDFIKFVAPFPNNSDNNSVYNVILFL